MKREEIKNSKKWAKDLQPGDKVYFGDEIIEREVDKVNVEKQPYAVPVVTFKNSEEVLFMTDYAYTDKEAFIKDTIKDAEDKEKEEEIRWNNETIIHDSYTASLHLRIRKFKKALEDNK